MAPEGTDLPEPGRAVRRPAGFLGSDLAVDGAGQVHLLDAGNAQLLVWSVTGEPLEPVALPTVPPMDTASSLAVVGDTLLVLDPAAGRMYGVVHGTAQVRTEGLPTEQGTRVSLLDGATGASVARALQGDALARMVSLDSGDSIPLGPLVVPRAPVPENEAARRLLADGQIPDAYRNAVQLGADADGVSVALQTELRLRRYARDGTLEYELPVLSWDLNRFRADYMMGIDSATTGPVQPPRAFYDVARAGDVDWLLLGPDELAALLMPVSYPAGALASIVLGPVEFVRHFAVDPERGRAYLFSPRLGRLLAVAFPQPLLALVRPPAPGSPLPDSP